MNLSIHIGRQRYLASRESIAARDGNANRTSAGSGSPAFDLVKSVQLAGDGRRLITTDHDGAVRLFSLEGLIYDDIPSPQLLDNAHHDPSFRARFSDDDQMIVTMGGEDTIRVWDAGRAELISEINMPDFRFNEAALTRDGKLLATQAMPRNGGSLYAGVWHTSDGTLCMELPISSLVFDKFVFDDGGALVAASDDRKTFVWNTGNGQQVALFHDENQIFSVAFRPRRRQIVTSTTHGVSLWDLDSRKVVQSFTGFGGIVNSAMFDRSGERLLGLSQSDNPRLWTLEHGLPNSAVVFAVRDFRSRSGFPRGPVRAEFLHDGSRS